MKTEGAIRHIVTNYVHQSLYFSNNWIKTWMWLRVNVISSLYCPAISWQSCL